MRKRIQNAVGVRRESKILSAAQVASDLPIRQTSIRLLVVKSEQRSAFGMREQTERSSAVNRSLYSNFFFDAAENGLLKGAPLHSL